MYHDQQQDQDNTPYTVVVNDEEQYSIWPATRTFPRGWKPAGHAGNKTECLDFIRRVWVDMRPRSLRTRMEHAVKSET